MPVLCTAVNEPRALYMLHRHSSNRAGSPDLSIISGIQSLLFPVLPTVSFEVLHIFPLFFSGQSGFVRVPESQQDLGISTGALLLAKGGHNVDKATVVLHWPLGLACLLPFDHLGSLTLVFPV